VVEGHRDAHPITLGVAAPLPDEEAVVEDVVWLSVAPFANPVVPLVYWMLTGSSNSKPAIRFRRRSTGTESPAVSSASQSSESTKTVRSSVARSGRTWSIIAT
jgi:hypothetical protein